MTTIRGATRRTAVTYPSIVRTHDSVHHKFVDEVGEVVARGLLVLVEEPLVCQRSLLECQCRNFVVLEDHFFENLVEHLLLKAENRLATGHANCFRYDKGAHLAEHDLFKVHTRQILLLTHIVGGDKVEKAVAAQRIRRHKFEAFHSEVFLRETDSIQVLHELVLRRNLLVLLKIGV